jgi:hypothetical protein
MKKKIYQIPETTIVKVQMAQMIAASTPEGFNENLGDEGDDGSDALIRMLGGGTVWDL